MNPSRRKSSQRLKDGQEKTTVAVTARIPHEVYEALRAQAEVRQVSLNAVVAEAIAQYQVQLERARIIDELPILHASLKSQHGVGKDSVELIKELRTERVSEIDSPRGEGGGRSG